MTINDYIYHILLKSLISGICPEGRVPFTTHMLCCYYYVIHLLFWGYSSAGCMWSVSGTLDYKQASLKPKTLYLLHPWCNSSGLQQPTPNNRFTHPHEFVKGSCKASLGYKLSYIKQLGDLMLSQQSGQFGIFQITVSIAGQPLRVSCISEVDLSHLCHILNLTGFYSKQ